MSYTLGMLGPICLADFREFLDDSSLPVFLPTGLGGSPVNLLSRELLKRGHRLVVVTLDPSVSEEVVVVGKNIKICIGPYRTKRARDFFAVERKYMLQAVKREKPDVLHAQWTYEFSLAALASGLPYVITAHDAPINVLRFNFIPYRIARTMMAYAVLRKAKKVVAVSPYVGEHLQHYMLYRGALEVIPNGLPPEIFSLKILPKSSEESVTFATVLSGWTSLKNGQVAIKAFSHVKLVKPEVRLIMFGNGHGPGEGAESWACKKGLSDGIEFVGEISHSNLLNRLANEVDILVHPSLEEAHPMAVIEAMAMGIPVIGGKYSGGVPWTLDYGKAGMLVDIKSPLKVSQAMLHLAEIFKERQMLGNAGRKSALKRFHLHTATDSYERLYNEAISKSSKSSDFGSYKE